MKRHIMSGIAALLMSFSCVLLADNGHLDEFMDVDVTGSMLEDLVDKELQSLEFKKYIADFDTIFRQDLDAKRRDIVLAVGNKRRDLLEAFFNFARGTVINLPIAEMTELRPMIARGAVIYRELINSTAAEPLPSWFIEYQKTCVSSLVWFLFVKTVIARHAFRLPTMELGSVLEVRLALHEYSLLWRLGTYNNSKTPLHERVAKLYSGKAFELKGAELPFGFHIIEFRDNNTIWLRDEGSSWFFWRK
jgi:hypothetical protein